MKQPTLGERLIPTEARARHRPVRMVRSLSLNKGTSTVGDITPVLIMADDAMERMRWGQGGPALVYVLGLECEKFFLSFICMKESVQKIIITFLSF